MVCRICQTDAQPRRYEFRELMFGLPETFTYVECRSCGCLQIETCLPISAAITRSTTTASGSP